MFERPGDVSVGVALPLANQTTLLDPIPSQSDQGHLALLLANQTTAMYPVGQSDHSLIASPDQPYHGLVTLPWPINPSAHLVSPTLYLEQDPGGCSGCGVPPGCSWGVDERRNMNRGRYPISALHILSLHNQDRSAQMYSAH